MALKEDKADLAARKATIDQRLASLKKHALAIIEILQQRSGRGLLGDGHAVFTHSERQRRIP